MLLGKSIVFVLLLLGMLTGLVATKDESLRTTMKLLLNSRITLMLLVLMASLLVGVSTGINPAYALEQWVQVGIFLLCGAILFVTLREMPGRHVELLMKVLAAGTMIVAALALVDALAHSPRLSAAMHGRDMALEPFRLTHMSAILAVVLPFVWARMLLKSREGEPFAIRVAPWVFGFGFVVAIVCGGVPGVLGLASALLIFLGMTSRYHGAVIHKRHWLIGAVLLAVAFALYVAAWGIEHVGDMAISLDSRVGMWTAALAGFMEKPLFGIGVGNYRHMMDVVDTNPNSWLLQVLLEGGIVSIALFVALMAMVFWRFIGFAKGNIYGVAALASLTAYMVAGLFYNSLFNGWWMTFLIVVCMLGWRNGWGGGDLKKRRRASVVVKNTHFAGK